MNQIKRTSKKEYILSAAARVFGQKGFYEATMEEIATEAGVGKGTVYEYFPSKLELFKEMHNYYAEAYLANYERINELASYADRIRLVFTSHLRFAVQNAEFARVLLVNPASIGEELKAFIIENRQSKLVRLRALIEGGIKSGEFRDINVDIALEMAAAFLGSLIYVVAFDKQCEAPFKMPLNEEDIVNSAQSALDIFLHGIVKK